MFNPQRLISGSVVALSIAALAAPGASAMSLAGTPAAGGHHGSAPAVTSSYSRQDKQVIGPATASPAPVLPAARAPRFTAPASGFSVTDGFLTLAGVLLLLALASGVALSRSRRRTSFSH